ncbi:hypothetical protein FACS1894205_4420 [Alphaproteobacteria bacterium]|nr:hypothetical protein FACS1894205_4420 [Alphaproteobacteria bacterium]
MDFETESGGVLFALAFLVITSFLWVTPFWIIFKRIGFPRFLALFCVIPIAPLLFLWFMALKKWPMEASGTEDRPRRFWP